MLRASRRGCFAALAVTVQLLIVGQLLFALFVSGARFLRTEDGAVSPFQVEADAARRPVVIVSLYSPLPLMLFACMAYLFAVRCEDGGVLLFSVACQALAGAVMLAGVATFLQLSWRYATLAGLTASYYLCVWACAEMAAAAALSWRSGVQFTSGTGCKGHPSETKHAADTLWKPLV